MVAITKEQYEEWRNALLNAQAGNSKSIKEFGSKYPDLYKHISSMLRKRTKLKSTLEAYKSITEYIYWGSLTWSNEHDNISEKVKRNQALRFFDKFFKLYCFVEEYGEEKGRYHIHFLGVLKDKGFTYDLMRESWHSFIQIECLRPYEISKKVKYLTKYCVKQVPRIRMNKRSVKLLKDYKRYKRMKCLGFDFYGAVFNEQIVDIKDTMVGLPF